MYESDADEDNLGEAGGNGKLWVYACGSQYCINQTVYSGQLAFDNEYQDERGRGFWPLEKGQYQAHMIRDEWPYVRYAESNIFEVRCTDDATIYSDKDSYDEGEEVRKRVTKTKLWFLLSFFAHLSECSIHSMKYCN